MILSIGQGNSSLEQVIGHLVTNEVRYLIDVRSSPYSRFNPLFSQGSLASALKDAGIRYVFMGSEIGGRPNSPACYTDGRVDYDKCHEHEPFLAGIERLLNADRQELRVSLFCSEGKPTRCHRSKLIGIALARRGVHMRHILPNGEIADQTEVIRQLTGGQTELFGPTGFTSRNRYAPRSESFTLENPHVSGESFTLENPHPTGEGFTLENQRLSMGGPRETF